MRLTAGGGRPQLIAGVSWTTMQSEVSLAHALDAALAHYAAGDLDAAEREYRALLPPAEALGSELVWDCLAQLAHIRVAKSDLRGALPIFRQALDEAIRIWGEDSDFVTLSSYWLGEALLGSGQPRKALILVTGFAPTKSSNEAYLCTIQAAAHWDLKQYSEAKVKAASALASARPGEHRKGVTKRLSHILEPQEAS